MKLNVLVAFPYFTSETRAVLRDLPREQYRLIINSGAYTAWNSGHPFTLDDYCRFLDTLDDIKPDEVVQLDVFGEHDETWRNFLTMRKRGYDVMPVFTRGAPIELLDEMYAHKDYLMSAASSRAARIATTLSGGCIATRDDARTGWASAT